jgi:molybdopterin biosynthesis enzyme MoaB
VRWSHFPIIIVELLDRDIDGICTLFDFISENSICSKVSSDRQTVGNLYQTKSCFAPANTSSALCHLACGIDI